MPLHPTPPAGFGTGTPIGPRTVKALVGGAFVMLTLFGATSPYLGITPSTGTELAAAACGALLGVLLAVRP